MGIFDGLTGMFGKSPDNQDTIYKTEPGKEVQPHLLNYYSALADWYKSNPQMVADASPETQEAWRRTAARAQEGSPLADRAKKSLFDNLTGSMLNPETNYQQQIAQGGVNNKLNDVLTKFNQGRYGNADLSAYSPALKQAISGLSGDIYGQEKSNQARSLMLAPSISGLDYSDISRLADVGTQKRAYEQSKIDEPLTKLNAFGAGLQPGLGFGNQTQSVPINRNPWGGAVSGAMAGSSAGWGGALAGGILGYLTNR